MSVSAVEVAARNSGVAPLFVHFDATGSSSSLTSRPFHDLYYLRDFGDPAGGAAWSNGAKAGVNSKNSAESAIAGHVYETPGSYLETLNVFDGVNIAVDTKSITVSDPNVVFAGTNTVVVSTSGNFAGKPTGAAELTTSNFGTVCAQLAAGKRVLGRRGESWTGGGSVRVNGPWLLGAFASGAAPVVTGGSDMLTVGWSNTQGFKDGRVMDWEFDNNAGTAHCMAMSGTFDQMTFLRVNCHDGYGIEMSPDVLDFWNNDQFPADHGHTLYDQFCICDSTMQNITGAQNNGVYMGAQRFAVMGNLLRNSTGAQHVLRVAHGVKGYISQNTIANPATTKHALKFHATPFGNGGVCNLPGTTTFSALNVISFNKSSGGTTGIVYSMSLGPDNPDDDQRLRDFIIEGNWYSAQGFSAQLLSMIIYGVTDFTVRNNLFDVTGAGAHGCVDVERRGVEPQPLRVNFFNNTFYSSSAGSDFAAIGLAGTVQNSTIRNNLGYAPNHTSPVLIQGSGTGLTASNNSSNANVKSLSPQFVSGSPANPDDFRIQGTSYAVGGGFNIPLFYDAFGRSRISVTNDMGFYQFNAGANPSGGGPGPLPGALTLAGLPPLVSRSGTEIIPTVGAMAFSGVAAVRSVSNVENPQQGALTLTGATPAITSFVTITPTVGALALAGVAPAVIQGAVITPQAGALSLTGTAPSVLSTRSIIPLIGALSFSGNAPIISVSSGPFLVPATAALSLTGTASLLHRTVTPLAGSLSLQGTASLTATVLTPGRASLVLQGIAPSAFKDNPRQPLTGSMAVLTGGSPLLVNGRAIPVGSTGLAFTATAPILRTPTSITVGTGSMAISGNLPSTGTVIVQPSAQALALTAFAPSIVRTRGRIAVNSGALAMKGSKPTVTIRRERRRIPRWPQVILHELAPFFRKFF